MQSRGRRDQPARTRGTGIPLPLDVDKIVPRTVAEIISRQRADGGFGLWPDSQRSYPWLGAYALFVLSQANQHGVSVPKSVFERGRDYLRRYLADTATDPYRLPTMAFVVDVLADMGTPDFGYMQQLYERKKELPLFAKALLLHALGVSKAAPALVATTVRNFCCALVNETPSANNGCFDAFEISSSSAFRVPSTACSASTNLGSTPAPAAANMARSVSA